jgi:preprotein translocase subunit SecG
LSILANILLVVNVFVCIALIAIVLVQRSEGGALGMGGGGGPSGFMTARGAGDLLTRTTWILAFVFFALAIAQTLLIGRAHGHSSIIDRLNAQSLDFSTPTKRPAAPAAPSGAPPAQTLPAPAAPGVQQPAAPAPAPANPNNPFAGLSAPAPAQPGQKTP